MGAKTRTIKVAVVVGCTSDPSPMGALKGTQVAPMFVAADEAGAAAFLDRKEEEVMEEFRKHLARAREKRMSDGEVPQDDEEVYGTEEEAREKLIRRVNSLSLGAGNVNYNVVMVPCDLSNLAKLLK